MSSSQRNTSEMWLGFRIDRPPKILKILLHVQLRAVGILPRPTVIEEVAPGTVRPTLYIIAIGMLCKCLQARHNTPPHISAIHKLNVAHVTCLPISCFCKLTTAHNSGCVISVWLWVHNFTSPFQQWCTPCQMSENRCWPVAHNGTFP